VPVSRLGAPIDGRRGTNRGEPSGSPLSPARARATILLLLKPFGLALSVVMPARCTLTIEPSPGPPKTLHIRVLSKPPSRPFPGPPFIEASGARRSAKRCSTYRGPSRGRPSSRHRKVLRLRGGGQNRGPSRGRPSSRLPDEAGGGAEVAHRGPSRGRPSSRRGRGDRRRRGIESRPFPGPPFIEARSSASAARRSRRSRPFPGPPFIEASG